MIYPSKTIIMPFGSFGEVRLISRDLNGRKLRDTGWIKNMILNQGLLQMSQIGDRSGFFYLGDSAAVEVPTQTGLQGTTLSVSDSGLTLITANSGSPNYHWSAIQGRRHNAGWSGTVREMCVSRLSDGTLISNRVVVPDFPVTSDQIVDSYWKMICVPPLGDVTGQVTIKSVLYDYTMRLYNVDQVGGSSPNPWIKWGERPNFGHTAHDGNIGTITGAPSGNSAAGDVSLLQAISGRRDWRITFGIDAANFVGGIRSISSDLDIQGSNSGIQVEFSNASDSSAIPKDEDHEIYFDLGITWSET